MEQAKRRSRMHRKAAGKRIELSPRDIELLKLLDRYHYLRSNFLYAFLGGNSETRFKERLGDLYHDGAYINRPEQQWQFANCRYMPLVYEIDAAGEQVLASLGIADNESPLLSRGRTGAYRQFAHQLMICECMASIELGARQHENVRFISWREIMERAPAETKSSANPFELTVSLSYTPPGKSQQDADVKVIPDGLFGLEYTNGTEKTYRFFALEVDRNTMPLVRSNLEQTSYLRKLLSYRAIVSQNLQKTRLNIPNLFVLTLTNNEQHMKNIMNLFGEISPEGSKLFLFKTAMEPQLFGRAATPEPMTIEEPWQRVGFEPFALHKM